MHETGTPFPQSYAQPHTEEGADQYQIVEVGEHPHLSADPPNERKLQRENSEICQANLQRDGSLPDPQDACKSFFGFYLSSAYSYQKTTTLIGQLPFCGVTM